MCQTGVAFCSNLVRYLGSSPIWNNVPARIVDGLYRKGSGGIGEVASERLSDDKIGYSAGGVFGDRSVSSDGVRIEG